MQKGEIYLANLGDVKCADIGKTRPVLIFQNNHLNRMIEDNCYSDIVIIPLSSRIIESDFTLILPQRENLEKKSLILCHAIKMIDAKRIVREKGILYTLTPQELQEVEQRVLKVLDIH